MCLNDTYPFCQQPLSDNCHSICFSKPVLWAATPAAIFCFTLPLLKEIFIDFLRQTAAVFVVRMGVEICYHSGLRMSSTTLHRLDAAAADL